MFRDYDPRDDDWRGGHETHRAPLDRDRPEPGRGGGAESDARDAPSRDPREAFTRDIWQSRDLDRATYHLRDRAYDLRRSEVRTLATVGAFRVVPASDLRDHAGRELDARRSDLHHLRQAGLVRTTPHVLNGERATVVSLTRAGRDLLNAHRQTDRVTTQRFYSDIVKPRELTHDAHVYRAYLRVADRLVEEGARVNRVVLDYELKREYQQFLQAGNRDRPDSDGRPTCTAVEIDDWAHDHHLPVDDGHVSFPDVRIEYELPDGRRGHEDVEVMTEQYRGEHASGKASAGFTQYRATTGMGGGGRGGRGSPFDPRVAERF